MKYVIIYLLAINLITLVLYGLDKHFAIKQKWRIPNRVLIGFAALGGTIGALIGMYTFRHKTKTKLYTVTVPLFLIIQIIALMLLLSSCGADLAASAGNVGVSNTQTTELSDDTEPTDDIDFEDVEAEDSFDFDESEGDESLPTEEDVEQEESVMTYVLNTNTYKFHEPDCGSVKQMKDKNKLVVEATREDIISKGYDPCGNCNP